MKIYIYYLLASALCISSAAASKIDYGSWSKAQFNTILQSNNTANISHYFLKTAYKENTLIGDSETQEELVVDLGGVDCFTYIDYVESIRVSHTIRQFTENLQKIRYKNGIISYKTRNHFFSDWITRNDFDDITQRISDGHAVTVAKQLNRKGNSVYLKGIPVIPRKIHYIPTKKISTKILNRLQTGDYIGIYSGAIGLDVSHVGIVIKKDHKVYLRHASSRHKRVVAVGFKEYMSTRKGFMVVRHAKPILK